MSLSEAKVVEGQWAQWWKSAMCVTRFPVREQRFAWFWYGACVDDVSNTI